jgi:hypothetical protein
VADWAERAAEIGVIVKFSRRFVHQRPVSGTRFARRWSAGQCEVADDVTALGPDHAAEIGYREYGGIAEDGSRSPRIDDYQVVWHRADECVWRDITDMFDPN